MNYLSSNGHSWLVGSYPLLYVLTTRVTKICDDSRQHHPTYMYIVRLSSEPDHQSHLTNYFSCDLEF